MKTENDYEDQGVKCSIRIVKINPFQTVKFWWQRKFGRYKGHYVKFTDADGNTISSSEMMLRLSQSEQSTTDSSIQETI